MLNNINNNYYNNSKYSIQNIIFLLNNFWANNGCIIEQPLDIEVGAGTFHPSTFLRALGGGKWSSAYVQSSRRPKDGRYGDNPIRTQKYFQYQVVIKPSPKNFQNMFIRSLIEIGVDVKSNDIKFVEDNWESPSLGAWGLGWEVWLNGMEVTQFTYFQQVGGIKCFPIMGEITYGLERIAMHLQKVKSFNELIWGNVAGKSIKYKEMFLQNEKEMSNYNFNHANVEDIIYQFNIKENEINRLIKLNLPLASYEIFLKLSHMFNLLDSRNSLSPSERQRYILRLRSLSKNIAESYSANLEKKNIGDK